MKKYNYMMMIIAAIGIAGLSGCGTIAYTESEKTSPDGQVTRTKAKVMGFGDKAAQVAAEGMFSDGTDEDLGSGFAKAKATQESSGVADTLVAFGGIAKAFFEMGAQSQGFPIVSTPKATATTTIDNTGSLVRVYLNGTQIDQFDPTGMTAEAIATRAGCTTGNCSPVK